MAQLIRRGRDTWLIRVSMGKDVFGRRVFLNRTVHGTKREAQAIAAELEAEKAKGTLTRPSKLTVAQYLHEWLDTYVSKRVTPKTLSHYRWLVERFILPVVGGIRLDALTPMHCQRVVNAAEQREDGRRCSRTARFVHVVLNSALKQAVKLNLISRNPAEAVEKPKAHAKEMRPLSPEEAKRFLQAAKGTRHEALFGLLLDAGLRPSEALALRWQDINLEQGVITVRHSLERLNGQWRLKEPKTAAGRRSIPVSAGTVRLLKVHKARQARERLQAGPGYQDLGFVFANQTGEPLSLDSVRESFKRTLRRAGLPEIRLYDLRHSAATLLLASNVHPKVVQERLGHVDVSLTLGTYSHVLPGMQQKAAEQLGQMLYGG
ncbi:MAG: site-specific integrase [Alicyclobacillaceae bacterium]|nr:site-specific integrase [Alicyclobacillaceae bacterium]